MIKMKRRIERMKAKMKKKAGRVMMWLGAMVLGVMVCTGAFSREVKADSVNFEKTNKVVKPGETLEGASGSVICYIKPGCTDLFLEASIGRESGQESPQQYILTYECSTKVREAYPGYDSYIMKAFLKDNYHNDYFYILEPFNSATAQTYVEPAWLTACRQVYAKTDKQIQDAKAGDTVTLEIGEYCNLSNARMKAIAEKNDVSFVLTMTYEHVNYRLAIPTGAEIDLSCEWYGPLKLLSMFDYEIAE